MKRWYWFTQFIVGALLATACLPQGVRIPQSPLLRVLERKVGLIAYVGTDGNIYTVDQAGNKQTPLTADAATSETSQLRYGFPTWSRDGKRLAFVGYNQSEEGTQATLYTADRDGENQVEAFQSDSAAPFYLYWSPDSQSVTFLSTTPGGDSLKLDMVPAEGGEVKTLDAGQPYYWSWAPDSKSMLVHVNGASNLDPSARLAMLRVEETVTEQGMGFRPALFQAPEISPNGEQMLFAAEDEDGTPSLMLADRSGSGERVLTTFEGTVAFALSPDGDRLAYIRTEQPRLGALGNMTIVDLSGKGEPIEIEEEPVLAFFWAPDGEQIAYFVPSIIRPTPNPDAPSASGGEEDIQVVLNLFVANANSGQTRPVAGFRPTDEFLNILPYFDQYHRSATIWSPDSNNLVLSAYAGDGTPGVWVSPSDGNLEPRFLIEGLLGFWSWK